MHEKPAPSFTGKSTKPKSIVLCRFQPPGQVEQIGLCQEPTHFDIHPGPEITIGRTVNDSPPTAFCHAPEIIWGIRLFPAVIIRLFSVSDSRMKNPHNPDIDILRLKPLYNGSTCICVGMYESRISRYSKKVLQGGIMSRVPSQSERRR
jgi:hypothetical protein